MDFEEDNPLEQVWRRSVHATGTLYDFGDGRGLVAARRHVNPNGMLGGWVADSAFVDPKACIEMGAAVYGGAEIHKNAWLLDGSIVRDGAKIKGAVILGRAVVFENYATIKAPSSLRHPIYIGYDPKMLPLKIIEKGQIQDVDYAGLPKIICREHPVVIHWTEKGCLNRVIYTDDKVFHVRLHRGYDRIENFHEEMKTAFRPRGETLQSWNPLASNVSVYAAENVRGRFPVLKDGVVLWPDKPVRRVGRMPTTIGDPKFYMCH